MAFSHARLHNRSARARRARLWPKVVMRLLVVEDEAKMRSLLKRGLSEEGYVVDTAPSFAEALWLGVEAEFDAIVLDLTLPDGDGLELCRRLRSAGQWAPVLMLTARDGVTDRVRGLDSGADDYLTKPFSFDELSARVRALMRRGKTPRPVVLCAGPVSLDPGARTVTINNAPVLLTALEFALLELLMRRRGETLSRARIRDHVWDQAYEGDSNIVDVYIRYLREKIDRPFALHLIETVRGVGYRIRGDDHSTSHTC